MKTRIDNLRQAQRLGVARALAVADPEPFEICGRNAISIARINMRAGTVLLNDPRDAPLVLKNLGALIKTREIKFDPDEPRDEQGKWTDGGGDGGDGSTGGAEKNPKIRDAFENYDNVGYEKVNEELRSGKLKGEAKETVETMDQAFAKASLAKDATAYRYFGPKTYAKLSKLEAGAVFQDKGFVSTATSLKGAQDFAKWHATAVLGKPRLAEQEQGKIVTINVPKGSKAVSMTDFVDEAKNGEKELLLNRGTQFRVVSKSDKGITVEVV